MDTLPPTNGQPRRDVSVSGSNVAIANVASRHRISWGAVFGGSVLAGVISLCLNLLGAGIGVASLDPAEGPGTGMGIGAGIWLVVSSLIALFVGGWAASRLAGSLRRADGVLHGLITWGFVTLMLTFLFSSAVGRLAGGALGLAERSLPAAAERVEDPGAAARQQAERIEGQMQSPEAERTANVVGGASIVSALALLLGGLSAGLGGALAARRNARREATSGVPSTVS